MQVNVFYPCFIYLLILCLKWDTQCYVIVVITWMFPSCAKAAGIITRLTALLLIVGPKIDDISDWNLH